ncbi:30S ribosomal protein S20 [Patescibacteria group bacterium]|nr:30S ribosomal protein S20 [Patescibacteria group bacterium]
MPNIKSAAKAMRQSARRRQFNLAAKEKIKQSVKEVRKLLKAGDKSAASEAMKKAMAALDKAAKKGIIHKNHASRKKSRLSKEISK